ncbi:MAG: alpha/beta fold hydrolase [Opitutaceae bacterium]|nr:alpha/beta fold hydrolase [Opitutaceae bacterium]
MLTLSSPVYRRSALLLATLLICVGSVHAQLWRRTPKVAPTPGVNQEHLNAFLRPLYTTRATLSRDGRHLAYTITKAGSTTIEVVGTDYPYPRRSITLGDLAEARLTALDWIAPGRLVFATEEWTIGVIDIDQEVARAVLDPIRFSTEIIPFDVNLAAFGPEQDSLRDVSYKIDRPPRLVRFANHSRAKVIIEGVAGAHLRDSRWVTAELNLDTGEVKLLDAVDISTPAMRALIDRSGRFRLVEERDKLPIQWRVGAKESKLFKKRWRSLDSVLPPEVADPFSANADTLWTERSFPLAFDADPDVLIYASNVGRNTYGIFGIDLSTGEPTNLAAIDQKIDLADPAATLFSPPLGDRESHFRSFNVAMHYTEFRADRAPSPLIVDRNSGRMIGIRPPLEFARTRWIDPRLTLADAEIARAFPDRDHRIIDWDDTQSRFLVHLSSASDPGRYFVFEKPSGNWTEFVQASPQPTREQRHHTERFTIRSPSGLPITGQIAVPNKPLIDPPSLVVYFPDALWQSPPSGYSPAMQTLAETGCLVLQVDYPGTSGRGNEFLFSAREAPDQAALAAVETTLKWLQTKHSFSPRRIAVVGAGYGGWLALRAAELRPDLFRCVVSLNGINSLESLTRAPPERESRESGYRRQEQARNTMAYEQSILDDLNTLMKRGGNTEETTSFEDPTDAKNLEAYKDPTGTDNPDSLSTRIAAFRKMNDHTVAKAVNLRGRLASWYFPQDYIRGKEGSVLQDLEKLMAPLLICQEVDSLSARSDDAIALRRQLRRLKREPRFFELPAATYGRSLEQRPETWLEVADFLYTNLYNFNVEIGPTEEVL